MIKEGAFAENEEEKESVESAEDFSEEVVKSLLEAHHEVANAGTKGIILKLLRNELPAHVREAMAAADGEDNPEGTLAIKALKIYAFGDAQREYERLKEAREISSATDTKTAPLAKVPRTSGFFEINAGPGLRDALNNSGAFIGPDGKVGLIIMDFIEGEDLATLLYKEVLKRAPDEGDPYPPDMIDRLPFDELRWAVSQKLGFAQAGGKSRDENVRAFEDERVKNENEKKLFHALEKSGFVLPEGILSQISNTVARFHKNGFYHNDLHERNVILKDGDLQHPQTYIIDYGSATRNETLSDDPSRKPADDNGLVKRLRPLVKTAAVKRRESINESTKEWETRFNAFENNPRMKARYDQIAKMVTQSDVANMDAQFGAATSTDTDVEIFLSALLKISREHPDRKAEIIDYLTSQERKKANRGFVVKRIQQWKEAVGNE
ncbi:MAG: lipopolysaccharide kinase InaA family protein [Candidatus Pacebacteria bacterium]|nr:lipopolysaccharide kinase InaA family protein [Candidatus Paceibacterota bacterium]